jgi:proline dehydrogenase
MRKGLLWASTNAWMRERATRTGFVRKSVVKFMPGEKIEDAIEAARQLKPSRLNTILTRLGENLTRIEEAVEVSDHYHRVIDLVQKAGLDAQISVKPTQLGYDQDPDVCFKYCAALLDRCDQTHNILWLDMESSKYVDGTIALYRRLRERSPAVGIAIQAYLYRTEKDIEALVPLGAAIRLVKGAYLEPPDVAYPKKSDVDENYYKLAERLLSDDAAKPGALVHFGTHDIPLQERILKVIRDRNVPKERYEIAMLYGIQTTRQTELGKTGVNTRVLISYGEYWFPWYMRRLAERPANVWFVVKNMFR